LPFASLNNSPLAHRPAEIHYREYGSGAPLVFLHGGWGYHIYPINKQLHLLANYRVLIPDRSGYGLSTRPADFTIDFHIRAAEETFLFLDALGIGDAVLWGHSDGSVIAAWMGLMRPERCRGLILEAFHYHRRKIDSRAFFETMASAPESFGEHVAAVLAREHGESYWRELVQTEGRTWLEIAKLAESGLAESGLAESKPAQSGSAESGSAQATSGTVDLFNGTFPELRVPTFILQGAHDPRTDPGEMEAVQQALPAAHLRVIALGEHCPHSESKAAPQFEVELLKALSQLP